MPDGLPDVDADLARMMRAEQRELQEVAEAETENIERAGRGLDEVALEYMHRGDLVRIAVGPTVWSGEVVHVGRSLLSLRTTGGAEVDIGLDRLTTLRVVSRSSAGGRSVLTRDPASLAARLRDLQRTGEWVELGGALVDPPIQGTVRTVAREHVEVEGHDGAEWVLALGALDYVIRGGV